MTLHIIEPKYTVFVYGTLKRDHGNYDRFLGGGKSTFLGEARTMQRFVMTAWGAPMVFRAIDKKKAWPVRGEVHQFDSDEVLQRLDSLEGYMGPTFAHNHYNRVEAEVMVRVLNPSVVGGLVFKKTKAMIYLGNVTRMPGRSTLQRPDEEGLLTWRSVYRSTRDHSLGEQIDG